MTALLIGAWKLASPWIVAGLLPSILVGLTKSPKTSGVMGKILKVAQYLSVATHVDHPGTLKMPLTASQPDLVPLPEAKKTP